MPVKKSELYSSLWAGCDGLRGGRDAGLAALERRLGRTRDLKQGMMQELLTGRTRLV